MASCSAPAPAKPLKSTYWSLIQLNDQDSQNISHQPSLHLIFHINDNSLHGNDGCNTLTANYVQGKESFRFTNILSSKIICEEGSEQAQAFLLVLKDTNQLLIEEDQMFLYHNEQEIARFEAEEDY